MSLIEDKAKIMAESLERNNVRVSEEQCVKLITASVKMGRDCKPFIPPEAISERCRNPRPLDKIQHRNIIRKIFNIEDWQEKRVLAALHQHGIDCTAEEIATMRSEIP